MRIKVGKFSGFCIGVKKAIYRISGELNSKNKPKIYGEIIHNPQVINVLSNRGLQTIHNLDDIAERKIAIRTHGIPVNELKIINNSAAKTINLTCSKVSKVQGIIKKYALKKYHTLILGDADHIEVQSLISYASSGYTVISSLKDIKKVPDLKNMILVSQTTLNTQLFKEIISKLKSEGYEFKTFDTICNSTHNRQNELIENISNLENSIIYNKVVIIGGKNSGNTKRLSEISNQFGATTYHIETSSELDSRDFNRSDNVFVTAGASTPTWIINNVINKLFKIKFNNSGFVTKLLYNLLYFTQRTGFLEFIHGFIFSYFLNTIYNYKSIIYSISTGFIFWASYLISKLSENSILRYRNEAKYYIINKYRYVIAIFISLFLSFPLILNIKPFLNKTFLLYLSLIVIFHIPYLPFFRNIIVNSNNKYLNNFFSLSLLSSLFLSIFLVYSTNHRNLIYFSPIIFSYFILKNSISEIINYEANNILGNFTFINSFKFNSIFKFITTLTISMTFYSCCLLYVDLYLSIPLVLLLLILYYQNLSLLKNNYNYEFKNEIFSVIFPIIILFFTYLFN